MKNRFSLFIISISIYILYFYPFRQTGNTSEAVIFTNYSILNIILTKLPLALLTAGIYFYCRKINNEKDESDAETRFHLKNIIIPVLLTFFTLSLSYAASLINGGRVLYSIELNGIRGYILVLILSATVSISEELFFRFWIISFMKKIFYHRTAVIIIVSSLLFSSIHLWEGTQGIVLTFIIGIIYSVLYIKTERIGILISAHFLHNAAALIIPVVINN